MTTIESYRKFGMETRGFAGCILMAAGGAVALLGLIVCIVDQVNGTFGLEGAVLPIVLLVFSGMAFGLVFPGVRLFRQDKKRVDGLREAYESGRCVMADIVAVRAQTSFDKSSDNMFTGVRYRKYYLVECHYRDPDTGVTHICYSRSLYSDPTERIIAGQVPVYIDRNNEENIFVDIDRALSPA